MGSGLTRATVSETFTRITNIIFKNFLNTTVAILIFLKNNIIQLIVIVKMEFLLEVILME